MDSPTCVVSTPEVAKTTDLSAGATTSATKQDTALHQNEATMIKIEAGTTGKLP